MKKIFRTGSCSFFEGLDGFFPKDVDILIFDDSPKGYEYYKQISYGDKCVFEWNNKGVDFLINYALNHPKPAMQVIKFLSPGVADYIGLGIDKLQLLKPLIDALDSKHEYAKVIYQSYIENGKFELIDKQRLEAFEVYKKSRQNNKRYGLY